VCRIGVLWIQEDASVTASNVHEPLTVSVREAERLTGISRSKLYEELGNGLLQGVKNGRQLLIVYASLKARQASLPTAQIKPPKPRVAKSNNKSATQKRK
jgi:hypothetical protein